MKITMCDICYYSQAILSEATHRIRYKHQPHASLDVCEHCGSEYKIDDFDEHSQFVTKLYNTPITLPKIKNISIKSNKS